MGAHDRELWVQVRDAAALPAAGRADRRLAAATPEAVLGPEEPPEDE